MSRLIGLVLAIILWCTNTSAQSPLRVYFFDVGQGDAVLIQSPSGNNNVLYDGGDSPDKILTSLDKLSLSHLDLVVASHNHADHIGGLAEVIRRFRPRFFLDNGVPTTTLTYRRVLEAVQASGTQLLEPTSREIRLGESASLTVLPPSGVASWDQNDNVVGLIVVFGQFRLSLAGDAEGRQWNWWIQNYGGLVTKVHVHKASHHGSSNGDTRAALARLRPEAVIISAGRNNAYGHPQPEALHLYAECGSTVFRTDINGTVLVEAEASGHYTIRAERGEGIKAVTSKSIR